MNTVCNTNWLFECCEWKIEENQSLTSNLSQEKSKNENLSAENNRLNNRIAVGSVLRAYNITTKIRYKSNGTVVETNKDKQVQKLRTSFVLAEKPRPG